VRVKQFHRLLRANTLNIEPNGQLHRFAWRVGSTDRPDAAVWGKGQHWLGDDSVTPANVRYHRLQAYRCRWLRATNHIPGERQWAKRCRLDSERIEQRAIWKSARRELAAEQLF